MKLLILYTFITAALCIGCKNANVVDNKKADPIIASACCDAEGTCSGDKSCSACKNCKYCKHCSKNGGSCGVCK